MKNFVAPCDAVEVTVGADHVSGDPVLIGSLFGIADKDVDVSVEPRGIMNTRGVFDMVRDASDVFTEGLLVFFNASAKEATIDANGGANKLIGVSMEGLSAGAGNVEVRLNGISVS